MEERKDHLWKVADDVEERIDSLVDEQSAPAPLGLDVGTSKVVASRKQGQSLATARQLNAFMPVAWSKFTEQTLNQNGIAHFREGEELVIYGTDTERFANMFNAEVRRPMADGMINPRERMAMPVLETILRRVVPKAAAANQVLAFSVPAAPAGREAALTYHEATLRRFFGGMGYKAVAVNEGLAVIFSELEAENFTGIGISCGGGMCNVALAFLSIPSILYAVAKGGDHIDGAVGSVLDEHATRVRVIKEESLDLSRAPQDKYQKALHIYYEELVETLVDSLQRAVSTAEKLPKMDRAIPIVLSGGSAKPAGFKQLFEAALKRRRMPIEISDVRLARDPLTATARGAWIAAMYEG